MRSNKHIFAVSLSITLCILFISGISAAQSQDNGIALQKGYRTGYSDGYIAGYRDTIDSVARNYTRHDEYSRADRAYSRDYGTLDDYRDGYKQGFETGYDTGYERRSFEAALPTGLKPRGGVLVNDPQVATTTEAGPSQATVAAGETTTAMAEPQQEIAPPAAAATTTNAASQTADQPTIIIPRDTELILELQQDLNTEQNREGDKFTARVAAPSEIGGATIEGRISKIQKPGRIKRRSELSLTFDRIILSDTRWSNMSGSLIEVMPVKGDNIRRVDNEGTAIGPSSLKSDAVKVGGATGAGAITGAVIGGPVGAAVGAGVGAAFGVGAVVIERGKHVRLNRNQQIRIKTAYETQIR
jgi:hypothetical protein